MYLLVAVLIISSFALCNANCDMYECICEDDDSCTLKPKSNECSTLTCDDDLPNDIEVYCPASDCTLCQCNQLTETSTGPESQSPYPPPPTGPEPQSPYPPPPTGPEPQSPYTTIVLPIVCSIVVLVLAGIIMITLTIYWRFKIKLLRERARMQTNIAYSASIHDVNFPHQQDSNDQLYSTIEDAQATTLDQRPPRYYSIVKDGDRTSGTLPTQHPTHATQQGSRLPKTNTLPQELHLTNNALLEKNTSVDTAADYEQPTQQVKMSEKESFSTEEIEATIDTEVIEPYSDPADVLKDQKKASQCTITSCDQKPSEKHNTNSTYHTDLSAESKPSSAFHVSENSQQSYNKIDQVTGNGKLNSSTMTTTEQDQGQEESDYARLKMERPYDILEPHTNGQ